MWSLHNLNGDFAADSVEIREVWDSNLEDELSLICSIIADYPFVSMDTEFPAVLVPSAVTSLNSFVFKYQNLKRNVDVLKLIQLGLTFFDSSGHLPHFGSPPRPCIWQFNFREFDAARDIFDRSHIELLRHSGMDLEKDHRLGVTADRFSELIISSGVVQNDSVQWITFYSFFDLGYLLKTLTCRNLPDSQEDFCHSLRLYFPKVYDIKHLMKFCNNLHGGLNKVAEDLGVARVGTYHQAGLDSLLVAAVFMKLKGHFFHGSVERYAGFLCGLCC
ncbi:probable CCR4-associated factor 1 homolog 7 [Dendrobium catenatum]|uniref:poly(A)-specific ribonuclease n=1 Tax=Dendrobium catenatum TaxID=906689 RepID=A0A2I0V8R8_9ASPA|nr:probable CCR4-associated factor 1 homolog 7 [Dendrobium catenatum]PKU59806.1 putative CCR4-associated factor 1 like 7 [Dendrobium catenatum]